MNVFLYMLNMFRLYYTTKHPMAVKYRFHNLKGKRNNVKKDAIN